MSQLSYNWKIVPADEAPALLPNSVFRNQKGLFESMLAIDHEVPLLPMHLARLMKGMQQTDIPVPPYFNEAFLKEEIRKVHEVGIQHSKFKIQKEYNKVRLQVFLGSEGQPSFILETTPINEATIFYNETGLKVGIVQEELKEIDGTENLKRITPAMYTSVSEIIKANGWDDVLLVHNGVIMESGTSNIFWVKDGQLYTPPASAGCIEGVMRTFVIDNARDKGHEVLELPLTTDILLAADEVFLTNAVRRIKWVSEIDGTQYTNGFSSALYHRLFGG